MSKEERQKVELSPDVQGIVSQSRFSQSASQRRKKARDAARVRVRLDAPKWLKDALEQAAQEHDTSMSQLGAFLLAWALQVYHNQDGDLLATLERCKTSVRAMNWGHGFELSDFAKIIEKSAKEASAIDFDNL
jgi:hypothetical protein